LNIKPGKPFAYGRIGGTPILGLPGNPASAFVTFFLIARPYLKRMQGCAQNDARYLRLPALFDWPHPGKRQEYLRARIVATERGQVVEIYPNQSSGVLASVTWANALTVVPPNQCVRAGDYVDVLPIIDAILVVVDEVVA